MDMDPDEGRCARLLRTLAGSDRDAALRLLGELDGFVARAVAGVIAKHPTLPADARADAGDVCHAVREKLLAKPPAEDPRSAARLLRAWIRSTALRWLIDQARKHARLDDGEPIEHRPASFGEGSVESGIDLRNALAVLVACWRSLGDADRALVLALAEELHASLDLALSIGLVDEATHAALAARPRPPRDIRDDRVRLENRVEARVLRVRERLRRCLQARLGDDAIAQILDAERGRAGRRR